MALWDLLKIETRDTSRRLIFMSVLGKINDAFSHCIMLFNGAIHLIKREHFWNIYVFCFLHTRRPSGPVQIFPSAWLQFLRCRLFLCIMMDNFAFLYSLPNTLHLDLGVLRRKDLNKALAYWIWFAFIWSWSFLFWSFSLRQSVAFDEYKLLCVYA